MSQINTDKIASNAGSTTALTIADNGSVTAAGTLGATTGTFSGNVGILSGDLRVGDDIDSNAGTQTISVGSVSSGSSGGIGIFANPTNGNSFIQFGDSSASSSQYRGYINYQHATDNLNFGSAGAERMRIDASGNVLVSCTTTMDFGASDAAGVVIEASDSIAASRSGQATLWLKRFGSDGAIVNFYKSTSAVGSISVNGSATAYNTSSDYRLKENVDYDWDATTRLKQLKPARFNFIGDADKTVDGFLAHEAQVVVPECVTGTKDEVDDNGDAVMQGIDQSKLVPLLVKTIQELEARITALEA